MQVNKSNAAWRRCRLVVFMVVAGMAGGAVAAAPDTWVQSVTYNNETITMQLQKENLRGPHFELWSQNATGGYDVITPVGERSYIGTVDEYPEAISCGILLDDGTFKGAVYFARGGTWRTLGAAVTGTRGMQYEDYINFQFPSAPSTTEGQAGTDMYAFDLAMDAEYDYFTQAGSSLAAVLERIEYSTCLVRAFYMRDLLLYPRLGRVVVRSTLAHDPYVGLSGIDYLNALKAEWETNHTDADRDLGVGVSPNKVGGGLAWTGTVGASNGYSINLSEANGDFDVVFRHELGHNWGSNHFMGGSPEGQGVMGGNQPARFTGCEAYTLLNFRDAKIATGGILDNMGAYTNIAFPPYASLDAVTVSEGASSVVIDVLANDHDVNAETLSIKSFDAISRYGVPVTLSVGTGAGGRDELSYDTATVPGTDCIFYTIEDSSGQTATGVVMINVESVPESILDADADTYVRDHNNHGQEGIVTIKRVDDNPYNAYNRTGWLHFDISTLSLAQAVQLRLPIDANSNPGASGKLKVWGIVDGRPGDTLGTDWTETGIEYWNTPAAIPFTEGPDTTFIGEVECGDPGEDMLVSGALLAFLQADTNGEVTFVLSREVDNEQLDIRSRESAAGGATLETIKLLNADAYVRGGSSADGNYGTSAYLVAKKLASDPGYTRESYLRFIYDDIIGPITSASLKLSLKSKDSDSGSIRIRLLDDADDYWDESSITWNTKSEGSGLEISVPVSNLQVGVEYSIDVSSLLDQSINMNRTASFHLDIDSSTAVTFYSREAGFELRPELDVTTPSPAPDAWVQSITNGSEVITMRLEKEDLRGENFELWSQNSAGGYDVVTSVSVGERSYLGTVDEYPGAISCGILQDDGLFRGAVYFDRGKAWDTLGAAVVGTRAEAYDSFINFQFPSAPLVAEGQVGTNMYAFDLGIDVDHDHFVNASSNVATVLENVEYSTCVMRAIYMRDLLLRPFLGRVIVRSELAHNPYTGLAQGDYLNALRTEWNNNHAGADRDLVVGVSPTKIGGGLAFVGTVGSSSGYSVNQSYANGEFDVVARHEIGHNWGCNHFVGGSPEGSGIMGGNQAARFSGCEAYVILNQRDAKLAEGGILDNLGSYTNVALPPYAAMDAVSVAEGASITIDILANDHDGNIDTLLLHDFDAISPRFGTSVTLSAGTGSGGRDELVFGPATEVGTDYFLYTVVDSSGKTATGVVVVQVEDSPDSMVETDADAYFRDGTARGQETTVIVKRIDDNPANAFNRTGLIHFDVSSLTLTRNVQLRLPIDDSSDAGASGKLRVWGIVDGALGDALGPDWTEAEIVASNAPQEIPFADGTGTTLIAEIECGDPGEDMLIGSDALLAFLEADTNGEVTFLLSREVDNEVLAIRARESAGGGATLETFALLNADAFVRGGESADNNYGSATTLDHKTLVADPSYTRESYLRFVYEDLAEPIDAATLKLTLSRKDSSNGNLRIRLLEDADDYWGESSITWNTKPEGSGLEISVPISSFQADVEYSIDVSSLLGQSINSNQTATFHLDIDTGTAVSFYSREAGLGLRPVLDLRTADTDHDGIPDDWENAHALDPLVDDAAGDADLDGFSNWYEYVSDTDPQNGSSVQGFIVGFEPEGTNLTIRFGTSSNRLYGVEFRDDLVLGDWQNLSSLFLGLGSETNLSDSTITTQRFYRLRVELP